MVTVRARHRLTACGLLAALLMGGCGAGPPPGRNAPDGTVVTQDGVDYAVQTSRELNPSDADDRTFLGGPANRKSLDRPGMTLVGVFLQARNDASSARRAVARPQLVSASGQTFEPLSLPRADAFAYRGGELVPGAEVPGPQSVPRESPEEGAVVVYRVPAGVFVTDRPFVMRFGASDRAASVQLDL